jgi:hypothetical protein
MTDSKIALEIEAERKSQVYHATPDELRALDEEERSGVATAEETEAAFSTFRRHEG